MSNVQAEQNVAPAQEPLVSPGGMLRSAREDRNWSQRETADQLNWMPDYVEIIEADDFKALRSPPFARGYVRAYGRLLDLDERALMVAFDAVADASGLSLYTKPRIETKPLQLQHTGLGVVVALIVTLALMLGLWWWQGGSSESADRGVTNPAPAGDEASQLPLESGILSLSVEG